MNVDLSTVVWHLKQIGKLKKLDKWVLHELATNFLKNCCFEQITNNKKIVVVIGL